MGAADGGNGGDAGVVVQGTFTQSIIGNGGNGGNSINGGTGGAGGSPGLFGNPGTDGS